MDGLAEMPEKPSEPPHLSPTESCDNGAASRLHLSASTSPRKVCRIASDSMVNSSPLFCCSKMKRGLEKWGSLFFTSSRSTETCAFWQPRLSTVAPATLG